MVTRHMAADMLISKRFEQDLAHCTKILSKGVAVEWRTKPRSTKPREKSGHWDKNSELIFRRVGGSKAAMSG